MITDLGNWWNNALSESAIFWFSRGESRCEHQRSVTTNHEFQIFSYSYKFTFLHLSCIIKKKLYNSGYTIPKGWKVLVWKRAVQMNPENFSAPKEFDPSRWEVSFILNLISIGHCIFIWSLGNGCLVLKFEPNP